MNTAVKFLALGLLSLWISGCQPQGQVAPPFPTEQIPSGPEITPRPSPTFTPEIRLTKISPAPSLTPEAIPNPPQPDLTQLSADIEQIIAQAGGSWHIIIREVEGETLFSLDPARRINIASVVKVPLALLFFEALEANGIAEEQLNTYLPVSGTGGRTFEQLLRAMLVRSEEDATQILAGYIGESLNLPAVKRAWNLEMLDLEARRYTAEGVADLFERFYLGDFVSPTAREIILTYLGEYTPNDDLRLGTLSSVLPAEYVLYNKRGSLLTPYVVADCAILENPNGPDYILVVFAYQGEPETIYERLEAAIAEIALAFARQIPPIP